ncbi:MAG: hypothetical protein GTO14_22815 [Anaerolineales bacterium]|nr:hypothetical protein [Anaerolineales bacterium]
MTYIAVTGVDGTGKTTLAKDLCSYLSDHGYPASYVYGRIIPVTSRFVMWLGRSIFLRKSYQLNDYLAYRRKTKETLLNPLLVFPYLVSISLDYFIEIWLKLLPNIFSSRIIILDRYVYDTIVSDMAAHIQMDDARFSKIVDLWFNFVPRPDRTYLICAPEVVSFSRKTDIPHIEYLRERNHWYRLLEDREEVRALDGMKSIETNIHIVIEDLLEIGLIEG